MGEAVRIRRCRSCGSGNLVPVLDLGRTPLADRLAAPEDPPEADRTEPLAVVICSGCALVQLTVTVPPDDLFGEGYPYFSSVSPALRAHFTGAATTLATRYGLQRRARVVEIASNDGAMLRHLAVRGLAVLGIDPSPGPASVARDAGVPTLDAYFDAALARRLVEEGWSADLVYAANVLAHVPDPGDFVTGIAQLLAPGGRAVFEVGYLGDLVGGLAFDTIYHQHLCYFSLTSLEALLVRHGLRVLDVERLAIQGGSLRVHAGPDGVPSGAVAALRAEERRQGLAGGLVLARFAEAVRSLRDQLTGLLAALIADGASIAAYGAAAKATTLLAYCGIDDRTIAFVADLNPHKWGRRLGGSRLPIVPPQRLVDAMPSHVLLLAWNFADEIMAQQAEYRRRGGRFIVPLPVPRVIEPDA